jgi:hypothetical protein
LAMALALDMAMAMALDVALALVLAVINHDSKGKRRLIWKK